jgi:hypothetical protein
MFIVQNGEKLLEMIENVFKTFVDIEKFYIQTMSDKEMLFREHR